MPRQAASEQSKTGETADPSVEAAKRLLERVHTRSRIDTPASQEPANTAAERQEWLRLVGEVVQAAKGSAIVHTDIPGALPRFYKGKKEKVAGTHGLSTFGDGERNPGSINDAPRHFNMAPGSSNLVKYDTDPRSDTHVRTMVEGVAFDSAAPEWTDPATGRKEAGMYFDYTFNPNLAPGMKNRTIYQETTGGRPGNCLIVRTLLSKELANTLKGKFETAATSGDPQMKAEMLQFARDTAAAVVMERAGISAKAWNDGDREFNMTRRLKPPYEQLPSDHQLFVLNRQPRQEDNTPMMVATPMGVAQ